MEGEEEERLLVLGERLHSPSHQWRGGTDLARRKRRQGRWKGGGPCT